MTHREMLMKALATTQQERSRRRPVTLAVIYACVVAVAVILMSSKASAQATKKNEVPKPRPVTLKTKDGIKLRAFYFPSDKKKAAIPVLLIHEWQGQASPYVRLLVALRDAGCAVLAGSWTVPRPGCSCGPRSRSRGPSA